MPAADDGPARLAGLAAQLLSCDQARVLLLGGDERVVPADGAAPGDTAERVPAERSVGALVLAAGAAEALVVEDTAADPRTGALAAAGTGACLGVALVGADGRVRGALGVAHPAPRVFTAAHVELVREIAASVVAELDLAALSADHERGRLRWRLAMEAAGVGGFDWDLTTGRLVADDLVREVFGLAREEFPDRIGVGEAHGHPHDLARVLDAVRDAAGGTAGDTEGGPGEGTVEHRVVRPDGQIRWVQARGSAVPAAGGAGERVVGVVWDSTGSAEGRLARLLETMSAAFYALDAQWRLTDVNAEAERLLGRERSELLGRVLWDVVPELVGTASERAYRDAVREGAPQVFERRHDAPLDGWCEVRAWPTPDGLSVHLLDTTERHRAQDAADDATARLTLLAAVSAELGATLDAVEGVGRLARLVVPALADWCVVTLVDDDGGLRDVGSWHVDPRSRPVVEHYAHHRLATLREKSFLADVRRSGDPLVVASGATEAVAALLDTGVALDALRALAPASVAVVPLTGRGRAVGILTLFGGGERGPWRDADLATARQVADRAGLALDNARLYARERELSAGLQRSLMTDPPQPEDTEVVVRYVPAAQAARVGGDWYDAFLQPGGSTVLVIGDVIGHDVASAAAMGQLRGLLRGIAHSGGGGPADVLRVLDQTVEGLGVATSATAVVARLEQEPAERAAGVTRLRWSSAGHPPPVVLDPRGAASALGSGDDADLLLGVDPSSARTEAVAVLERGSTVLLFTDGLVERRGRHLDEGTAELLRALTDLADLGLDDLCDAVLARMLPRHPEDDVALVAVRLHPQAPR